MIDIIFGALSVLSSCTRALLAVSFMVGQWLIVGLHTIGLTAIRHLSSAYYLLVIIVEDFHFFVADVMQRICTIAAALADLLANVYHDVISVIDWVHYLGRMVVYSVSALANGFVHTLTKLYTALWHMVLNFKYYTLLLGSGAWFLVTLVPLAVVHGSSLCLYGLGRLLDEVCIIASAIKHKVQAFGAGAYEFVFDVPLEALMGLVATCCIVYVLAHFSTSIGAHLHRRLCMAGVVARARWCEHRSALRRWRASAEAKWMRTSRTNAEAAAQSNGDHYHTCVVCHENAKTILLLPCRHVCLCQVCLRKIRNRKCPICRQNIAQEMLIYL